MAPKRLRKMGDGSCVYVTKPAIENHQIKNTLECQGKMSIKVGIAKGNPDCKRFTTSRYGNSRVHLWEHHPHISFERLHVIERHVLSALVNQYGYKKQHGKKEHFMIPSKKLARKKFVEVVKHLYNKYT
jgi:hypothetical protein